VRNRFPVQLAAGQTWSGANQKHFAPYSWIHLENRGVIGSGNDVLVDVISKSQLTQSDPDGFWRYLAAGQRLTANICGPDDAPAESLTLTNIGAAAVVVFVEISSTPIINFSDFPFEAAGGGGGGGPVTQNGPWLVQATDAGAHGPAAVKNGATAPVAADPALVVATSPNSPGVITTPVSAVAIAAGRTISQTVTVNPPTGSDFLVVVVSITAVTGGDTLTMAINGVTVSGYNYPLLAPAALSAVGVTPYRIGPALNPSTGAVANDVVPPAVQLVATVAGAGTIAYGVDVVFGD
jgi:hypothetical protein